MTSGEETMARMKAPVGWAGQSAMGQVQLITRFCSIRVVRYSFQQDWEGAGGAAQVSVRAAPGGGALATHRAPFPHDAEGQRQAASRPTSQLTLRFLASTDFSGIRLNYSRL